MAITQEQMWYTWLSQGVSGTPYKLKATEIQTKVFHPNPLLPAYPDKSIDVYTSTPYTIIQTWNNDTDFYAYSNSGLATVFWYPTNDINDIHHLQYVGGTGGIINIQACKEDGTVVSTYSTSIAGLVYESLSVDPAPDNKRYPVSLVVYAKQFGSQLKVGFGIAGHLSDQVSINDYPSSHGYLYDCGVGDISSNMSYALLDENTIADEEGGAPTGEPDGGGGFYDYPFGAIGEPQLPNISICDTGMIGLYNTNSSQMYQLANKLWDNNFFTSIIKNSNSPMDNIVSLHVVPFTVYGGSQQNIKVGNYDTEIPSNMLATSYFNIDCGILEIDGAYKTFADYAPYTDISLFLPYIGEVSLSPDDIIDKAINIKYNIDVFSGACVAYIMCRIRGFWTCLAQYQGNIATQYPISGVDYSSMYSGIINTITKAGMAGVAMGTVPLTMSNPVTAGLATAGIMASGAGQVAQGIQQTRPRFERSGNIGSSAGLMGVQTPYLIITKPNYIQATKFRETKGYISNLQCIIGDESGFIQANVDNAILNDLPCTDTEKNMIQNALASGIYV